ncbi:STAS domain-containing protein [Polyangium spumosum]|uniref:STAS domain-containing protein n=1 Tax=Polyangium spumosum TaxID=889282 RepID=A0A6N7PLD0_9BACT|nr:STAS domain-containing protein [Polyangium spumosum]MRG92729.1 STAS domain-containing protein [Polyangium spumosum]
MRPVTLDSETAVLRARVATLEALLAEHEMAAAERVARMERLVSELSAREQELAQQLVVEREKTETLERLRVAVHELSTPILEVWDGVLALPLIGVMDSKRAAQVMDTLLEAVARMKGRYVILDVTGVDVLDTATADHLLKIVRAVDLLGARCVLSGVRPSVAQTLVELGVSFGNLVTLRNLKHGLKACLRWKEAASASAEKEAAPSNGLRPGTS